MYCKCQTAHASSNHVLLVSHPNCYCTAVQVSGPTPVHISPSIQVPEQTISSTARHLHRLFQAATLLHRPVRAAKHLHGRVQAVKLLHRPVRVTRHVQRCHKTCTVQAVFSYVHRDRVAQHGRNCVNFNQSIHCLEKIFHGFRMTPQLSESRACGVASRSALPDCVFCAHG